MRAAAGVMMKRRCSLARNVFGSFDIGRCPFRAEERAIFPNQKSKIINRHSEIHSSIVAASSFESIDD
jgi:hypothetical protein